MADTKALRVSWIRKDYPGAYVVWMNRPGLKKVKCYGCGEKTKTEISPRGTMVYGEALKVLWGLKTLPRTTVAKLYMVEHLANGVKLTKVEGESKAKE